MFPAQPSLHPDLPPVPQALQHRCEYQGLTWLDFVYLRREQADHLREHFALDHNHAEDVLVRLKRPRLEISDNGRYLYLVLHFPVLNEQMRLPEIGEVNIIIAPEFVMTIHDGRLRPLVQLVHTAERERGRVVLLGNGSGALLCRILEALIGHTEAVVNRIDDQVDALDVGVFRRDTRVVVEELSYLRRDIISLRRIARPDLAVLGALARREHPTLGEQIQDTLGDLRDRLARIWEILDEQKEIIEGLDATITSLTSHRLNREMRIFTLISVIFLPMTLVASILGMNVIIPFADHPRSFVIAIILIIVTASGLVGFMRYKGLM